MRLVWLDEQPSGTKPQEPPYFSFWKVTWHCQTGANPSQKIHFDWEAGAGSHPGQPVFILYREQGRSYICNRQVAVGRAQVSGKEGTEPSGERKQDSRQFKPLMLETLPGCFGCHFMSKSIPRGSPRLLSWPLDQRSKLCSRPAFQRWEQVSKTQFILLGCSCLMWAGKERHQYLQYQVYTFPCLQNGSRALYPICCFLNRRLWFPWGSGHSVDIKWEVNRPGPLLRQLWVRLLRGTISMPYSDSHCAASRVSW